MTTPNMTLLYVDNPETSAAFYRRLLGQAPVELSPTFALFVLSNGLKLAMWSKHSVEPAATATGGGGEIGFMCELPQQVDVLYQRWSEQGLKMIQPPVTLDFGYSFVACDPDGHRLRVYSLSE
ncbi:Glyoxalase-like domain [Serratia quinivorans]|uniref:VOC family protein n=1 Tax=Serratia quinivorans TaxID=137545 RepID=UPI0021786FB5|nr:VOC family protein [Serratia quinivorans]CAI0726779.1 Glyoxalase-like domain [Serratia quinivorans]CAI0847705.1 Glyoxalase-like domain [Serratia quinivorans]CAI0888181.1 Glyoxalase-like domain [Serratia quinivorans]CAI0959541.1 Glyoxalase-like domain [Serratia quinivorans]CAI1011311.1 Glyoxalase-like domain [Serratia quinivorans]